MHGSNEIWKKVMNHLFKTLTFRHMDYSFFSLIFDKIDLLRNEWP